MSRKRPHPTQRRACRSLGMFGHLFGCEEKRLVDVITSLRLESVMDTPVGQLSKVYRRRLLIGLGLLAPQPLLVMDEPFDGLDLRQTRHVIGILRRTASQGRTLLLSIHQLVDSERVCDRIVLLAGERCAAKARSMSSETWPVLVRPASRRCFLRSSEMSLSKGARLAFYWPRNVATSPWVVPSGCF
jgi:ABC-type multidrug transport system ATPase subunit